MHLKIILFIIILFIIISIIIKETKYFTISIDYFTNYTEITNEKLVNCEGCLDENLRCHTGTVPMCTNLNTNICYSFYDENGDIRSPCGIFDKSDNAEESCKNCQTNCQWCIDKYNRGSCISREIFDCDLCPNSRICKENPFNLYIKKRS